LVARIRRDRLTLAGVKLQPRLGITPGERRFPQTCTADITLWGDFEAVASTDELTESCDYGRILAKVLETAHLREYNLVESLAYRIARVILEAFPVERVNVKVRKQPASLIETLDHVEIEVEQP
jgi:dihydroneopterin aldolase